MASNALKVSLLAVPLFGLLAVLAGLALLMDGVRSSFPWKFHQRNGYPTWLKNEPMELRWQKFPWVGDNTLNETIRMTFHRIFFLVSWKKTGKRTNSEDVWKFLCDLNICWDYSSWNPAKSWMHKKLRIMDNQKHKCCNTSSTSSMTTVFKACIVYFGWWLNHCLTLRRSHWWRQGVTIKLFGP